MPMSLYTTTMSFVSNVVFARKLINQGSYDRFVSFKA